jgi:hypothetical protein
VLLVLLVLLLLMLLLLLGLLLDDARFCRLLLGFVTRFLFPLVPHPRSKNILPFNRTPQDKL